MSNGAPTPESPSSELLRTLGPFVTGQTTPARQETSPVILPPLVLQRWTGYAADEESRASAGSSADAILDPFASDRDDDLDIPPLAVEVEDVAGESPTEWSLDDAQPVDDEIPPWGAELVESAAMEGERGESEVLEWGAESFEFERRDPALTEAAFLTPPAPAEEHPPFEFEVGPFGVSTDEPIAAEAELEPGRSEGRDTPESSEPLAIPELEGERWWEARFRAIEAAVDLPVGGGDDVPERGGTSAGLAPGVAPEHRGEPREESDRPFESTSAEQAPDPYRRADVIDWPDELGATLGEAEPEDEAPLQTEEESRGGPTSERHGADDREPRGGDAAGWTRDHALPATSAPTEESERVLEVADRLERIARTLRQHGAAGPIVERETDPLGALITGYLLGYFEGSGRTGSSGPTSG
jgi:hypothetical protein